MPQHSDQDFWHRHLPSHTLSEEFSSAAALRPDRQEPEASHLEREGLPTYDHLQVSLNDPISSRQHVRRNRQADLLSGFQINDELELLWLLHGEISGVRAFEDFIHVGGG